MSNKANGPDDLTNQVVAGYRVLHRLGRGGMSEVYLAFHENLRRHVALKVLRQDLVESAGHKSRFLHEARSAASLVHPNIVQVYDIGEFENVHYIAQEYIPGTNLRAYIQRRGRMPLAETISILLQVAAALQKAASVGIVHRDIKPDNILLTPEGEVKVADFGLARSRGQEMNLTEVGITLGTPLYMSPEQIQGAVVDSRSDLYSLGVTAFHMLAGRTPFEGDTPLALAVQHMQNKPTDLSAIRNDLPANLCFCVAKLLEKKPEDRFGSATALLRFLREIASELPGRWHGDQLLPLADLVLEEDADLTSHTMRLQTAMLTERDKRRKRYFKMAAVGVAFVTVLMGSFAAANQWRRKAVIPSLFDQRISLLPKATIAEQFLTAMERDDIEGWRAVEKYFPPSDPENLPYNLKAWWHLGTFASEDRHFAPQESREAFLKIIRCYKTDPYSVDKVIHLLALVGLMGVQRKTEPESNWREFRNEANALLGGLSKKESELFNTSIPQDLVSVFNSND